LTYVTKGLHSKLRYIGISLKLVIVRPGFDIIICGHINLLPLAFLLKVISGTSILLCIHGIDAWHPTKNRLIKYLVKKIDAFVSVSRLTKKRFLRWSEIREIEGFILPNAVDISKFKPGPKPADLLNRYGLRGKTVLMTLGRLSAVEHCKGVDEILELLPSVLKKRPDLMYLVAGDGTDRRRLMRKASNLGLENRVVFPGYISEQEKEAHYRLADVFVMPGRGEGFCIVLLEAMASGVPVVASKIDGSREAVLDGELGILVDPNNPEEIESCIIEALKRRRGIVPGKLDHFSYLNFEKRCHSIIDRAIGSPKTVSRD
jgi:glycosyltransferase involved in cell wall biosynthesis